MVVLLVECIYESAEAFVGLVLAEDEKSVDDARDPHEECEAEVEQGGERPAGEEDGDGRCDDGEDVEH